MLLKKIEVKVVLHGAELWFLPESKLSVCAEREQNEVSEGLRIFMSSSKYTIYDKIILS